MIAATRLCGGNANAARDTASLAAEVIGAARAADVRADIRIDETHGGSGVCPRGQGGRLQPGFLRRGRQLHHHLSAVGRACEHGAAECAAERLPPARLQRRLQASNLDAMSTSASSHPHSASIRIDRSVGTTGLRTAAVIVVFTFPAGAEKVRVTADGGEVARLVRGRVPAEVVLAERRRPCVASQLPPRSPLGSPG